jgi:eukaryotic-like serine/threonine-protein kinase
MTPERWQQVKCVLQEALEIAPEQRVAFLDRACPRDYALRREVESFLSSDNEVRSSFLKSAPDAGLSLTKGARLGDFEILSLIGAGGMGEVYGAWDRRLERHVAIKVLPRFVSFNPERLHRFEQEAKAAAALNHPNILAVFQMGTEEGAPYLVSELLEGETLREQVKRGRLPLKRAIDYGVQIAHGLKAAHDKGIVHRDLKPENLFVTKDGRIKILDFGLAKLTHHESGSQLTKETLDTVPGAVLGTVGYMSPEQVRGQIADHRSDIFALGAILYEMATGRKAFSGNSPADVMSAILTGEPPGITADDGDLAPPLKRIIGRCLEKSASLRFQSALDVAFALGEISDTSREGLSSSGRFKEPKAVAVVSPGLRQAIFLGVVAIAGLGGTLLGGMVVRRTVQCGAYSRT